MTTIEGFDSLGVLGTVRMCFGAKDNWDDSMDNLIIRYGTAREVIFTLNPPRYIFKLKQ